MSVVRMPEGTSLKVSEMGPGGGWISNSLLDGESDPITLHMKIAYITRRLAEVEVLNSRGLVCPRPS